MINPPSRHFLENSENTKKTKTFILLWTMSKHIQNGSLKEAKTIQNTLMGPAKRPPKKYFVKFGFFEAAILYIFGHIPTNAYAILAAIFQQESRICSTTIWAGTQTPNVVRLLHAKIHCASTMLWLLGCTFWIQFRCMPCMDDSLRAFAWLHMRNSV